MGFLVWWREVGLGAVFEFISGHLTPYLLGWYKGTSAVIVKQTLAQLQHMLTLLQFNDEWVLSTADEDTRCPVPARWQTPLNYCGVWTDCWFG